jgi:hypothetical protein
LGINDHGDDFSAPDNLKKTCLRRRSARQVHIWLREEGIELPAKSRRGEAHGVVWRLPAYDIVHNILTNPIYAALMPSGARRQQASPRLRESPHCSGAIPTPWRLERRCLTLILDREIVPKLLIRHLAPVLVRHAVLLT